MPPLRGVKAFEMGTGRRLSKLDRFGVKDEEIEAKAESFSTYHSETVRFSFFVGGKAPYDKE